MSLSVGHLRRALEPGFVLSTTKTLSDDEIASLREEWEAQYGQRTLLPWSTHREPKTYREPPPLSWWVTMDPLVKLAIIALPVALAIWLLN